MMNARLLIAVLYKDLALLEEALEMLEKRYGPIDDSIDYPFDVTTYYEGEMGTNLHRRLLIFSNPIQKEMIAELKVQTGRIEDHFRKASKRQINLDPGYITHEECVLASTKEKSFKVCLVEGLYAHTVLTFQGSFCLTYFHTFPDFKKEEVQSFILNHRPGA